MKINYKPFFKVDYIHFDLILASKIEPSDGHLRSWKAQLWKAESVSGGKMGITGGHDWEGAGVSICIHIFASSCYRATVQRQTAVPPVTDQYMCIVRRACLT